MIEDEFEIYPDPIWDLNPKVNVGLFYSIPITSLTPTTNDLIQYKNSNFTYIPVNNLVIGPTGPPGPSGISDGTNSAPSLYFTSSPTSGFYRDGSGSISSSISSVKKINWNTSTVEFENPTVIDLTANPALNVSSIVAINTSTTTSSSTTTGAIVVSGGVGISGDCYVGTNLNTTEISGTTLTINPTTLLSMNNVIGCRVWIDGQSIGPNVWTPITFSNPAKIVYDRGGFLNIASSTSRFTCPAGLGGYYLFTHTATMTASYIARVGQKFMKNGSIDYGLHYRRSTSASRHQGVINAIIRFDPGDYVEIMFFQNSAGNVNFTGSSEFATQMSLTRLF
jgi:hypothetical protein